MRKRAGTRGVDWTDAEQEIVQQLYPEGGASACLPYLPGRTRNQIKGFANRIGLVSRNSASGSPLCEDFHGVPVHDYTHADVAAMAWRGPVAAGPLRWAA